MPTHNFTDTVKLTNRHSAANSIHPEVESLDELPERDGKSGISTSKQTNYDDLFSSDIVRCSKSYIVNVRDNRLIHVQQYLPPETNEAGNEKTWDSSIVLFFIHGVGGSWKIWDAQIQKFLLDGYEIVSLDLLGHGLSSSPDGYKPYEFQELASDVLFVFDKFCKRRNVLIGHSYGTSFCALLSTERRHLISKMVLISGGGPTSLMPDRCSAFCLPLPVFFLIQPILLKFFRRMAFHVQTSRRIQDKITTFGVSAHVLKAIMQGQVWEESDEQYHADLAIPALLIYGSGDQFVTLQDEIWMNETIYGSTLKVIENAGHMVMIEAPHKVNNLIDDFLKRDAITRVNKSHSSGESASKALNNVSPLHDTLKSSRVSTVKRESTQSTPVKRCSSSRLSRVSSAKYRGKKMY